MNHLSMHGQTLFCRQLVGKVQDRARNDLAEVVLVGQGFNAGLSSL